MLTRMETSILLKYGWDKMLQNPGLHMQLREMGHNTTLVQI